MKYSVQQHSSANFSKTNLQNSFVQNEMKIALLIIRNFSALKRRAVADNVSEEHSIQKKFVRAEPKCTEIRITGETNHTPRFEATYKDIARIFEQFFVVFMNITRK